MSLAKNPKTPKPQNPKTPESKTRLHLKLFIMNLSSHILTSMQANTEKFDDTLVILGPKRKCNLLQKRMSSRQP